MDFDPFDVLKKILHLEEDDHSSWVRVATLKPEDLTRKIRDDADSDKWHAEAHVLISKIKLLRAQAKLAGDEWWEHLHQTYSLPRDRNFTITDEGFILMQPEDKKK